MAAKKKPSPANPRADWRVSRTVSFTPEQDRYFAEALGEGGNVSEFIRQLVDASREGRVNFGPKKSGEPGALDRARAYLRAKEAGMNFEEDVGRVLEHALRRRRGLSVIKNRIHNGDGVFVADFSLEDGAGRVVASVQCKSSPRADRLNLALAEAMIGRQKTEAPVITVVPYLLAESDEVAGKFGLMGFKVVRLTELPAAVIELVKEK